MTFKDQNRKEPTYFSSQILYIWEESTKKAGAVLDKEEQRKSGSLRLSLISAMYECLEKLGL